MKLFCIRIKFVCVAVSSLIMSPYLPSIHRMYSSLTYCIAGKLGRGIWRIESLSIWRKKV